MPSRPPLPPLPPQWRQAVFSPQRTQQNDRHQDASLPCIKRLAFIGDAVLQLCITEWLHEHSSSESTAELMYQRNDISSEIPQEWGKKYKLSSHIVMNKSSDINAQISTSKGDLFRAYVAAIYLSGGKEHGGLSLAIAWIKDLLDSDEEESNHSDEDNPWDEPEGDDLGGMLNELLVPCSEAPKTKPLLQVPSKLEPTSSRNSLSCLNEKATKRRAQLSWNDVESGPDHAKNWKTTLTVEGKEFTGAGHSKKGARCQAAENALKDLKWV